MKVKDLIKELSELNPESNIMFSNSIECFRSHSGCSFMGSHSITSFTKKEFKEELEECSFECDGDEDEIKEELLREVDKNGVVVFRIDGEENWNE